MKNKISFRTLITIVIVISSSFLTEAQVPQSFNYQAVLRNSSGGILQNQNATMKFSIHKNNASGTTVYEETHTTVTNNNGLVNLQIGQGTPTTGSFSSIQWGKNSYFLQVQADIGSGYINLGTTQFITVPYAMVADTALHYAGGTDMWQLLGTTILSVPSNVLSVSSFSPHKYLRIEISALSVGTDCNAQFTNLQMWFNSDNASGNYGWLIYPGSGTNAASYILFGNGQLCGPWNAFYSGEINNEISFVKLVNLTGMHGNNISANNLAGRVLSGIWNNTNTQITTITISVDSYTMGVGSRLNVYGHD